MKHYLYSTIIPTFKNKNGFHIKRIFQRRASAGVCSVEDEVFDRTITEKIESYWKDKVNIHKYNGNNSAKDKFYVLSMFPYPSGMLHMGHVRVYTISDCMARFYRMTGKNVIHPMGWDAFGLPAENAAIEKQVDPADWTMNNIKMMREQLNALNYSFDWDREFATCDPEYYKWTQELFLKLFEKGLVYQKEAYVNWDPVDKTVLAEEQVDDNNRSWRSGATVEKKLLNQWFIKTTAFAKSLLDGLNDPVLKEWRDIITIQKNWIGECNGTSFEFQLISDIPQLPKTINLWTNTPEFIEYAKFVAVSTSSTLSQLESSQTINGIIKLNATVLNPFTGDELPVFITNTIQYPTWRDNYLGIPSVSMDDFKFAESVGIPFQRHNIRSYEEFQTKRNEVLSKARKWNIGGYPVSSRLTDWLISRQRYWGTPIPIIHCKNCGIQPVPRDQLPVVLPNINHKYELSKKHYTLADAKDWLHTVCPSCGGDALREADTMDTFVDSCWYFLRYIDPKNQNEIFSVEKAKKLLPVDLYIGGKEHALLHLYYARFINHFLYEEGFVPTREPFKQLLIQGMVMGKAYQIQSTGQYIPESQVIKDETDNQYKEKDTGRLITVKWEKMSKSKYNGVNPLELLKTYGIDTTRLLILADVAPTSHRNWSTETIAGVKNWQNRIWMTAKNFINERKQLSLEELQKTPTDDRFIKDHEYMFDSRNYFLKTATFNIVSSQQLSVAISRMQGLTNSLKKVCKECMLKSREFERALAVQIIMLAPLAPHFASELWAAFCSVPNHLIDKDEVQLDKDVLEQKWPEIDMDYKMIMTVYVNKHQLKKVKIPRRVLDKLTTEEAVKLIRTDPSYQKYINRYAVEDVKLHSRIGCDANLYIIAKKATEEVSI